MQGMKCIAIRAMWLLSAFACTPLAVAQDDTPPRMDDAQIAQAILDAEATGRAIYLHDQAAAVASDAVMEALARAELPTGPSDARAVTNALAATAGESPACVVVTGRQDVPTTIAEALARAGTRVTVHLLAGVRETEWRAALPQARVGELIRGR